MMPVVHHSAYLFLRCFALRWPSSSCYTSYRPHLSTAIIPGLTLRPYTSSCRSSRSNFYIIEVRNYSKQQAIPKPAFSPTTTTTPVIMSEHIIENATPVMELDSKEAFSRLSLQEKLYTHYLSKASWVGSLITLYQTSKESPVIFSLFNRIFSKQSVSELKQVATAAGLSEEDFTSILVYVASILGNMGNYKGFGDLKFIPNLEVEKMEKFVSGTKAAAVDPELLSLFTSVKDLIYSLELDKKCLGFPPKGTTTYFTPNCTEEDANVLQDLLKENKIDGYNHRAFKDDQGVYEVRFASIRSTDDREEGDFIHKKSLSSPRIRLTRGDYSPILQFVNLFLEDAKVYASNQTEVQMIEKYIDHFRSGDLESHKDGSRYWINNKGPVVETYIGFIETYRDPAGLRAEFEAFVALVDKERSKAFQTLVSRAEELLKLLPWGESFEKDKFLQPDFTSLDVVTFSGSGIPAGINIPNYDEIRQNQGFKNVSLGNVISCSLKEDKPNFLSAEDAVLLKNNLKESFEVQVGLHELLGHGSGKLFRQEKDASFNFDSKTTIDPFTQQPISCWYNEGESYDSKFGSLGSAFEECRAECVGLYLCLEPEVVSIFGFTEQKKIQEIIHANWLSMIHSGIQSLRMYEPTSKKWLQAHSQARYAITRILIQAGQGLVSIKQLVNAEDGKDDLLITFDPEKIHSVGKKAIGDFLLKLQVLKSTGDSKKAVDLFDSLTAVNDSGLEYPFLTFRKIAVERRKPRKLFVQPTTLVTDAKDDVLLKSYEASLEGMMQSFVNNFPEDVVTDLFHKMQKLEEGQ